VLDQVVEPAFPEGKACVAQCASTLQALAVSQGEDCSPMLILQQN